MAQSTRVGTGQITVTSNATQILPANQDRLDLTLTKLGAENVFLGCNSSVTTSSGFLFAGTCGSRISIGTAVGASGALFGITVGASVVVSYLELTQ
jgi:hypothetical protein